MKRLTLAELKEKAAQKDQLAQNVEINLEAIKGGDAMDYHMFEMIIHSLAAALSSYAH